MVCGDLALLNCCGRRVTAPHWVQAAAKQLVRLFGELLGKGKGESRAGIRVEAPPASGRRLLKGL